MIVQNVHHIAIIVSDYEKSRDFYVNKLGFQVIREEHRAAQNDIKLEVQLGNCMLEIFKKAECAENPGKPNRCGVWHLCFYAPDLEKTIAELTERLEEAPVDVGLIGIGENAHIAFNDPPADFNDNCA